MLFNTRPRIRIIIFIETKIFKFVSLNTQNSIRHKELEKVIPQGPWFFWVLEVVNN